MTRHQVSINLTEKDLPVLEEFEKVKPKHQSRSRAVWEAMQLYIEKKKNEQ